MIKRIPRRKQVRDLREGDRVRLYGTIVDIIGTPGPGASPHGTVRPALIPGWVYVPMVWDGIRCAPPEQGEYYAEMAFPGEEAPEVTPEDRVTEPIYAPTLEMDVLAGWRNSLAQASDWKCARCGQSIEGLSTGHYFGACLLTGQEGEFHYCCPGSCELHERRA